MDAQTIIKFERTHLCNLRDTERELPEDDALESKHVAAINK